MQCHKSFLRKFDGPGPFQQFFLLRVSQLSTDKPEGKTPGHRPDPSAARNYRSENAPWSTVWQCQFTTSLTNWSLNETTLVRLDRVGAPSTGSFFISISWLLYVVGVTVYVILHTCALCQWPHPCRLDRLFHESFLRKISILCQFVKVFSLESFPLYGMSN